MKQKDNTTTVSKNLVFHEVEVRRLGSVQEGNILTTPFEKWKTLRTNVKITKDEADALNAGRREDTGNKIFAMYLLPGEEVEPLVQEIRK